MSFLQGLMSFFPNKVTRTAMIYKLITVLMDFAQSDCAGDKGSGGARVKLDTISQCNTSTNLPAVITENGEIDLGLIAFTISSYFTAFC